MRTVVPIYRETMRLSELARDCLRHMHHVLGRSDNTIENYDTTVRQFIGYLKTRGHDDDLRSFTNGLTLDFATYLGELGVKPATIRNKLSALATLADFGITVPDDRGRPRLSHNPVKTFKWPKMPRPDPRFLRGAEFRAFRAVERPERETLARDLLIDTWLRASEICRLNVEDLVEIAGSYYVTTAVKGQRRGTVPVSRAVAMSLLTSAIQRKAKPDGPLLVNSYGNRWSRTAFSELVQRIALAAGITRIKVRAHTIRHTMNVIARVEAKLDVYARAKMLNHSDTRTLEAYDHLVPDELVQGRESMRTAMDRYCGDVMPAPSVNGPGRPA